MAATPIHHHRQEHGDDRGVVQKSRHRHHDTAQPQQRPAFRLGTTEHVMPDVIQHPRFSHPGDDDEQAGDGQHP